MRRIFLLLFILCGCGIAQAQKPGKHFRMAGYVQMPNMPLVSYYLELDVAGNTVKGYSITGYQDGNRLKASVSGYFTTASDMYIQETGSLDDRATSPFQTYCFFSAHLKLTVMMNGKQRWNGTFDSRQANGIACGGGTMTITDQAPPLDEVPTPKPAVVKVEMPKPPPPPPKPKADTPKAKPPTAPIVQKPKDTPKRRPIAMVPPEVKPAATPPLPQDSCQRSYDWGSDNFSFDVWDGWTTDGDVISMKMNGRSILERVRLDEKKQHFNIPLARGLNVLYISLHEEGYVPPNTPNMTLYDGNKVYEVAVSGNTGEVARICIWRK